MTLGERCDEILRLIEETLGDIAVDSSDPLASPPAEDLEAQVAGPSLSSLATS